MSKEALQVSFSSISCAPVNVYRPHEILLPHFVTTGIVERASHIKEILEPIFEEGNVGISLHPAVVVDVPKAARLLEQAHIPITSIDSPDIIPHMDLLKKLVRDHGRMLSQIGWSLQNVSSEKAQHQKLTQGIAALHKQQLPHIVRAPAHYWMHSRRGEVLRKSLAQYPDVILAIEIDAMRQTPDEYISFLEKLREDKESVPVYADIDLGHLAESKYFNRHRADVPDPLVILESLLHSQQSSMVALVSLNQYQEGDVETHRNILHGNIDLLRAARLVGSAVRGGTLPFGPKVLVEAHPIEYDMLLGPEGVIFFKKIKQAFDQGKEGK